MATVPESKPTSFDEILKALGIKGQPVELNLSKAQAIMVVGSELSLAYVRSKDNPEEWIGISLDAGDRMVSSKEISGDFKDALVKPGKFYIY